MVVFGNGKYEARLAATGEEAMQPFHRVPAVVFSAAAVSGLEVDFFIGVLADIGDPQISCQNVKGKAPRVAETDCPDFRTSASRLHKWIVARNTVFPRVAFDVDPKELA